MSPAHTATGSACTRRTTRAARAVRARTRAAISSRARARIASGIRRFGGRGGATRALWDRSGIVAALLDALRREPSSPSRACAFRARGIEARADRCRRRLASRAGRWPVARTRRRVPSRALVSRATIGEDECRSSASPKFMSLRQRNARGDASSSRSRASSHPPDAYRRRRCRDGIRGDFGASCARAPRCPLRGWRSSPRRPRFAFPRRASPPPRSPSTPPLAEA